MTLPKLAAIQATTKAVQDDRQARKQADLDAEVEKWLPSLRETVGASITVAAQAGNTSAAISGERRDSRSAGPIERAPLQALRILAKELNDEGYQACITGNNQNAIEIKWTLPEPDKIEISFDLGGRFKGREKDVKILFQAAFDLYQESLRGLPITDEDEMIVLICKSL